MKKRIGIVGAVGIVWAVLLVITLVGFHHLGDQKANLNSWSEELAVKEATLNKQAENLKAAQVSLNEARQAFEQRTQYAEQMRQVFTGFLSPSWEQEVKMAQDSYGVLDQRFDQYRKVGSAMRNLGDWNVTWEDVGVNASEVHSAHNRLGRTIATELIQCLDQPISARRGHDIGQGEGTIMLDDPWDVGREIVHLVNASGTTIQDYGLSPEQFRAKLVQDCRDVLVYARSLQDMEQYGWAILRLSWAINEYNIAGRELGLTQKERDFLWKEYHCYVR
ncbi:MAG: hypothetical protein PHI73_01215 [Patescibacteria group bacterium]|nr:hypothetical protein [Patescibacteria group bacterium]